MSFSSWFNRGITSFNVPKLEDGILKVNGTSLNTSNISGSEVNVKRFGAIGNGVADDTAAIQSALNYMTSNNVSIFFPSGTYLVTSTLSITGKWMIYGEGSRSIIKTTDTTIPLFEINVNTTTVLWPVFSNIHFYGPQSTNSASCAIRFLGDNVSYIQHGIFDNLYCTEFNAFVKDEKDSRTTVTGLEAMLNWNIWSNIQIYNTSNYGFWLTKGSGTGNTWNQIKCMLRNASSVTWFFDGVDCVAGDVIIEGAHLGCRDTVTGSIGIKIGDSTKYRSRWSISNSQFDAHCDTPIVLSSVGSTEYTNWKFANNNIGGNALLGNTLHYMSECIIEDMDVDLRQSGKRFTSSTTGSQTKDCFDVDLDSYGTAIVNVKANGLVGGIAACISDYEFRISTSGSVMTITEIESTLSTSGQLTWSCASISANKEGLTITLVPSSTGTDISTVISSRGRKYKITRL